LEIHWENAFLAATPQKENKKFFQLLFLAKNQGVGVCMCAGNEQQ
jgi:hypothetical protein